MSDNLRSASFIWCEDGQVIVPEPNKYWRVRLGKNRPFQALAVILDIQTWKFFLDGVILAHPTEHWKQAAGSLYRNYNPLTGWPLSGDEYRAFVKSRIENSLMGTGDEVQKPFNINSTKVAL